MTGAELVLALEAGTLFGGVVFLWGYSRRLLRIAVRNEQRMESAIKQLDRSRSLLRATLDELGKAIAFQHKLVTFLDQAAEELAASEDATPDVPEHTAQDQPEPRPGVKYDPNNPVRTSREHGRWG